MPNMPPMTVQTGAAVSHEGHAFARLPERATARQRALLLALHGGGTATLDGERATVRSRRGISRQDADDVRALHAAGRLRLDGHTYSLA